MLRMSDKKIIDIAAICGYENPSCFTEMFIKEVGISPSAYRKS